MVRERQQGANLMTIEADLARDESIDEIVSKARGRQLLELCYDIITIAKVRAHPTILLL